ncbi:MAG TPA: phosphatase PAP2 family protein [Actinocatenispora sp.]
MTGPAAVAVRPAWRGWWVDAGLLAGFVAITGALAAWPALLRLDVAVRDASDAHRPAAAYWLAWTVNHLGQGTPLAALALVLAAVVAWRTRTVRPLLPVFAAEILTYCVVGPLKLWTERGAPHYGSVALFSEPHQTSYPSGHLVNTIVWYAVIAALASRWLPSAATTVLRTVPVAAVSVTTVYLGYHWLTDTLAGLVLGVLLCRLLARVSWRRVPLPAALDRAAHADGEAPPAAPDADRRVPLSVATDRATDGDVDRRAPR